MKSTVKQNIRVGLLGLGTVGGGVAVLLDRSEKRIYQQLGVQIDLARALVRDLSKHRDVPVTRDVLTLRAADVVTDPEIDIVIEAMGGEEEAYDYVVLALESGKHVISANKDLIARHGAALSRIARANGRILLYEAAVGGAIPIIRSLRDAFALDQITEIRGIVNGTTNYILSRMTTEGCTFDRALADAQDLGYAEADPYADISGLDAARKMVILAQVAFGTEVALRDVVIQGIADLTPADIAKARAQGAVIKLIGSAKLTEEGVALRVSPEVLPVEHPLAGVNDVFNAIYVRAEAMGESMLYGRGAGALPTASAILGDLATIIRRAYGDAKASDGLSEAALG